MHIYIDESGSFTTPIILIPKISCVTALVLPSSQNDEIIDKYLKIRASWGYDDEIKGSKLDETQINQIIELLAEYDVIAEICAIDIGSHTKKDIENFQKDASNRITELLTPKHAPKVITNVFKLRRRLEKLSQPLAVQFFLTIRLIQDLLQHTTIYYAQHLPKELANFNWIIDGKDIIPTDYERLWALLILPQAVQSSLKVVDHLSFDYSYLDRFSVKLDQFPETIKHFQKHSNEKFSGYDLKMIMQENFRFGDSKTYAGLQLVDIVASCFTRAMNQRLQKQGWENLGKLFLKRPSQIIQLAYLDLSLKTKGGVLKQRNFFGYVVEQIENKSSRNLLSKTQCD